jgi:hypothetical protein
MSRSGILPGGGVLRTKRKYSSGELAEFERTMRVELPEAYKRYLRDVGAGDGLGRGVSLLEDWCQPYSTDELQPGFLAEGFPHTEAWNDLALLDAKAGWRSKYFDASLFRGAIRICNLGCEAYHLLVISGTERANIWTDERVSAKKGIYPLSSPDGRRTTVAEYLS